jgi:uncharacterized membrane protein YbhN (UPF0104 family)
VKTPALVAELDATGAAGERRVRYGLKLVVGVALVAWLIHQEGWHRIAACLARVSPAWFALTLVTYLIGQSLCAWKWSLLAESLGFRRPMRFFWVNYLGAMFCSLFLPTSVGGDVFRALALARPTPGVDSRGGRRASDKIGATVSVLADRGTGVLAMAWIATMAAAASAVDLHRWTVLLYLSCLVLTLGFLAPFWYRPAVARSSFLGRVIACWDHPARLLAAFGAAFLFQSLLGVIYLLLGQALGLRIDPKFYFLLCPLVSIAAMAPVSINGLGVREATLMALFPMVGVGADRALAFGLAWSGMVTLADLFGGIALLCVDAEAPPPSKRAHELRAGAR